jgi:hypothetical protein
MVTDIRPEGLEAARKAIRYLSHPETPWSDEQVAAVIRAYMTASPQPEAYGVRALEWGERQTNTSGDWTWSAKTSIGRYIASTASGERCKGSHFWFIAGETISAWANSEDEAKAAAQADYSARILAALEPTP